MNQINVTRENTCPRCNSLKMKSWNELSEDEKILVKKLPASAEFSPVQRERHRFCIRCFYEKYLPDETFA